MVRFLRPLRGSNRIPAANRGVRCAHHRLFPHPSGVKADRSPCFRRMLSLFSPGNTAADREEPARPEVVGRFGARPSRPISYEASSTRRSASEPTHVPSASSARSSGLFDTRGAAVPTPFVRTTSAQPPASSL